MTGLVLTPMPGRSFRIAGMVALSGIAAGILTVSREPASPAPTPAVIKAEFDARWEDVSEPVPLKKQDRLALPVAEPLPVTTERIVVDEAGAQVEVKPVEKARRHADGERNICTRHHMRKIVTRGGRSWRCRR